MLASLAAFSAATEPGDAALITGSYQLEYNDDVTSKGATEDEIRELKQTVDLAYSGHLSPVVRNEGLLKIEVDQQVNSKTADITRFLPSLELTFKSAYWEARAGGKRTEENSDDPLRNTRTTDNWFVEFYYLAPSRVPDLKAKYTLDTEFEQGSTDTIERGVELSSVYKPNAWLELKGTYNRKTREDRINPNSNTEEEKPTGTVGIRRLITRKIKAEAQYSVELDRSATLLDAGGSTNTKEDQIHKVKSMLAFVPFRDTSLDGSYDYELKQNKVLGEHTLTTNMRGTLTQKIGTPFDVKGEYSRVVTESRHTLDDNTKTEDTWSVEVKARFSKQLDFLVRRQDKHTVEDHVDATKSQTTTTVTDTATWTGELTPFWKASASYDRNDTSTWDPIGRREVKTAIDKKYSLKSTFDFKAIYLTIDPTYDITQKDDLAKQVTTDTRDFKLKIAYQVLATRTLLAKFDHTYGRKTDSAAQNIQRTDTTNGNVTWSHPLPGWILTADLTRQATDTSGDDVKPEITTTFGFKIDYAYEWLAMNTAFKYNKKSLTDDEETLDAKVAWTAPKWELSLAYNFTKIFSAELDEKYSLTVSFKYNL